MIDLYAWPTPWGLAVTIALEEMRLPYNLKLVDPKNNDPQAHEYLKFTPTGRIPVLVETENGKGKGKAKKSVVVWESTAICLYLAEKSQLLLSEKPSDRAEVYQWLMFQNAAIGPIFGQAFYYRKMAQEKNQEASDRFTNESVRALQSLELHLKDHKWLAGDYSIADIATFPWIKTLDRLEFNIEKLEYLSKWRDTIAKRPAVEKGFQAFKKEAAA